jgi:YggT family protein
MVILHALDYLLQFLQYAILARVIISWLPISKDNQIIKIIYQITEPVLAPVRGLIQKSALGKNMMVDFSPILVFLLIGLIQNFIR